jgi:hypothetical protein
MEMKPMKRETKCEAQLYDEMVTITKKFTMENQV